MGGGGAGEVQAYNFGNFDFEIRVEGECQDTSRNFKSGFGSMRLGAKMGPNNKILTKRYFDTIRFVVKKQEI